MDNQAEATRKPYPQPIYNNNDLIAASRWFGSHFFDKGTMRFFQSRLIDVTYTVPGGVCVFITSERFTTSRGAEPRAYTVRTFNTMNGNIEEIGDFQQYATLYQARKAWKAETQRINEDPEISARVQAWVAQREIERERQDKAFQERMARRQAEIDKHNALMERVREIEQAQ